MPSASKELAESPSGSSLKASAQTLSRERRPRAAFSYAPNLIDIAPEMRVAIEHPLGGTMHV